jgi:flagellar hook protein FlgE
LTDFSIQGDGFFIVSDGQRDFYTRDGAFDIGVDGGLVNPVTGLRVMGWSADTAGIVDTDLPMSPLQIPFGTRISAQPTADSANSMGMTMNGNLDSGEVTYSAGPPEDGVVSTTVTAYDSLGNTHTVRLDYRHTNTNEWTLVANFDNDDADTLMNNAVTVTNGVLQFTSQGVLDTTVANNGLVQLSLASLGTGATDPLDFTIDMEDITQFAGQSQMNLASQTGFPAGALVSFSVGSSGEVSGIYSNGANRVIGQLALAGFVNPGGLQRQGQNLWIPSSNSGEALVGTPNSNGRGVVNTGTLENSNVDLAQQFTNMIIAQRGFQSSSRVITASDTMLQDLVNIIR